MITDAQEQALKNHLESLDDNLFEMQNVHKQVDSIRDNLINRLTEFIYDNDLKAAKGDPDLLDASLGAFTQAAALLRDKEKAVLNKVNTQFKRKDQENDSAVKKGIIEALSKVNIADAKSVLMSRAIEIPTTVDLDKVSSQLDEISNDNPDLKILEGELKSDHMDLDELNSEREDLNFFAK